MSSNEPPAWAVMAAFREGQDLGFDEARLERALQIVQTRPEQRRRYPSPRADDCPCPDHRIRGALCKHILSRWIMSRATQIEARPEAEAA